MHEAEPREQRTDAAGPESVARNVSFIRPVSFEPVENIEKSLRDLEFQPMSSHNRPGFRGSGIDHVLVYIEPMNADKKGVKDEDRNSLSRDCYSTDAMRLMQ